MELLRFTLQQVSYAIVEPSFAVILILMAVIFYIRNKKTTTVEKMIMGKNSYSAFELTVSQIVIGIFGGTAASVILTFSGIAFPEASYIYMLFAISILFIYIKPEFGCFSYSGAVLGAASIGLNILSIVMEKPELNKLNVDIAALGLLVGIMHIVEGLVVMVDGKRGAIPVFGSKDGKIIGGFAYRRQWIFPMAIFLILGMSQQSAGNGTIATPGWWPIINHAQNSGYFSTVVLGMLPIFAGMNYTSVTFTKSKAQKPLYSGLLILSYGILISFISMFGGINIYIDAVIVAAIPLCHRLIIYLDKRMEEKGKVKFVSGEDGVCVLAVAPDSIAKTMGLVSGDIILEINNVKTDKDEIVFSLLEKIPHSITMKVKRTNGAVIELLGNVTKGEKMGLVIVPRKIPKQAMVARMSSEGFGDIINKIRKRRK